MAAVSGDTDNLAECEEPSVGSRGCRVGATRGCVLCRDALTPGAAWPWWQWAGLVAGTWLVLGSRSGQGSVNLMKGASKQGKSGSLLFFLPTHRIPNTMGDLTAVRAPQAPTDSTQAFIIRTVSKASSSQPPQVYLETVNWSVHKERPELKAILAQGKPGNTRNLLTRKVCSYCQARVD